MGEIKSALEIALEKADRIGRASKEEIQREKWLSDGKRIAADYIKGEVQGIKEEISKLPPEAISTAISGAMNVLLRNIVLPRDSYQWASINRAMTGIVDLKGSTMVQVVDKIKELLKMYEQNIAHYKEQVKMQFKAKLGGLREAVAQQYGDAMASNLDAESIPEFQQEWMRIKGEIDSQFQQQLQQLKRYIEA